MELKLYQKDIVAFTTHIDAYEFIDEGMILVAIKLSNAIDDPLAKYFKIPKNYQSQGYFPYYVEVDPFVCSNPECYWKLLIPSPNGMTEDIDQMRQLNESGCPKCKRQEMGVIKLYYDESPSNNNEECPVIDNMFDKMEVIENNELLYSYKPTYMSLVENAECSMCKTQVKCTKVSDFYVCQNCWDVGNFPEIMDQIINKEKAGFPLRHSPYF